MPKTELEKTDNGPSPKKQRPNENENEDTEGKKDR